MNIPKGMEIALKNMFGVPKESIEYLRELDLDYLKKDLFHNVEYARVGLIDAQHRLERIELKLDLLLNGGKNE